MRLIAIDGHDGSGKTTLATALAERLNATYIRPFAGANGRDLIGAWKSGQHDLVLRVGRKALREVLDQTRATGNWILDRGWLTVATLVPQKVFAATWDIWFPTALVWCDESTTRQRLQNRAQDNDEPDDWHSYFLQTYQDRLRLHPGPIVRTDLLTQSDALDELLKAYEATSYVL